LRPHPCVASFAYPNESDRLPMPTTSQPMGASLLLLLDQRSAGQQLASFCVRLPVQTIQEIDRLAAEHSANRATVARNLLSLGLQSLEAIASS
jgi:hypothetical protein